MSAKHEKIAAAAVKRAKKQAVLQETVGLLRKAAYGMAADEPSKQMKAKQPPDKPAVPPPAQMKSTPVKKPKAVPPPAAPGAAIKYSADLLMARLFIKAADTTKKARADAYKHATNAYLSAVKSGKREHIKKAVAHLAAVMTVDEMTKEAVTAQVGSAIMRLISKLTPILGKISQKTGPGKFGDFAEKAQKWGLRMGEQGQNVKGLMQMQPGMLSDILKQMPGAASEMGLAKQIGTGALAGAGGLAAGKYLMD